MILQSKDFIPSMLNLIARNLRLPSEELDAAVPATEEDDTAAKILRCCYEIIII